mmetsp:Transcript_17477/g.38499  ORF Transcript_17477/g.38499 Transcript_17477/m.38499 type:complete len:391 (+) Transcript_17477:290-1462(+)
MPPPRTPEGRRPLAPPSRSTERNGPAPLWSCRKPRRLSSGRACATRLCCGLCTTSGQRVARRWVTVRCRCFLRGRTAGRSSARGRCRRRFGRDTARLTIARFAMALVYQRFHRAATLGLLRGRRPQARRSLSSSRPSPSAGPLGPSSTSQSMLLGRGTTISSTTDCGWTICQSRRKASQSFGHSRPTSSRFGWRTRRRWERGIWRRFTDRVPREVISTCLSSRSLGLRPVASRCRTRACPFSTRISSPGPPSTATFRTDRWMASSASESGSTVSGQTSTTWIFSMLAMVAQALSTSGRRLTTTCRSPTTASATAREASQRARLSVSGLTSSAVSPSCLCSRPPLALGTLSTSPTASRLLRCGTRSSTCFASGPRPRMTSCVLLHPLSPGW